MKGNTTDTERSERVSTKQHRIAELARRHPEPASTALNHDLDMDWLHEAYRRTRKDGAPGVDEQSAAEHAQDLAQNLQGLLDRAKVGTYRAPPVKRGYVPKDANEKRPIGMPTFEDKVLQRAVVMVMEPIYEQEYKDCSHGFRPNHSAHQALESLWRQIMRMGGCWLIDADITKFFDTLDKGHLRTFLDRRVRDGVIRRLIDKWLKAGVLEAGAVEHPELGTPQGGVISPLLSNIYLHEVLDRWFVEQIVPRLRGRAFLIRYADDFVMGFERQEDAQRVLAVLAKRLGKYGLHLHPDKTRLVDLRPPAQGAGGGTFNFLGFTHHWAKSRKGRWYVQRETMSKRLTRAVNSIGAYCRKARSLPVADQWKMLCQKVRGHYAYYGITGNAQALATFREFAGRRWQYWLNRRSRTRDMPWSRFNRLLARYPLPAPRVVHSVYA